MDEIVERSLRGAHLWDEVKDRLGKPGIGLSGGQQQRLCIARAIAVEPDVLLMDEPASALDPIATLAIEDLIGELKKEYTIVIVTHNMQQASRSSDMTAFFNIEGTGKPGHLVEMDTTEKIFSEPGEEGDRGLRQRPIRLRVGLQEELDQLEAALQEEGELVRRALRGSLNALEQQDEELADEVIAFDDEVDRCYFDIETGIQSLLARQAPAAMDLRLVLAILHDNLHLERMADYCVTVAKLTKLVHDTPPDETLTEALEDMGTRAEEMIQTALDSFANRDVESAEALVDMDELIDAANRRVVHQILSISADPDLREWGLQDAARLTLPRADRRPRGRHRRADGFPRQRPVPRVHGRVALASPGRRRARRTPRRSSRRGRGRCRSSRRRPAGSRTEHPQIAVERGEVVQVARVEFRGLVELGVALRGGVGSQAPDAVAGGAGPSSLEMRRMCAVDNVVGRSDTRGGVDLATASPAPGPTAAAHRSRR